MNGMPDIVAHADWSTDPKKRWICWAEAEVTGSYRAGPPETISHTQTFIQRIIELFENGKRILLGFDYPIGLPHVYAQRSGVDDFLRLLPQLGRGKWEHFYSVAMRPEDISLSRPFYPHRPGGTRQQHLLTGLGIDKIDHLRRRCEHAHETRNGASPLFWTLGAQQVGKAAISGWQQILTPMLENYRERTRIWPFSGSLSELLNQKSIIIAETYPAEYYNSLRLSFSKNIPGRKGSKRNQQDRVMNANTMNKSAIELGLIMTAELEQRIQDGFGPSRTGEDQFDAFVGLLGMLKSLKQSSHTRQTFDPAITKVEGWILGQEYPSPK